MKAVIFTTCLLLAATGYSRWVNLAQELAGSASQQIPRTIAAMMSERSGGGARATQPGQEKLIVANLKEALRSLRNEQLLRNASVELKQVRYVTTNVSTNAPTQNRARISEAEVDTATTGYYVAALQYDLMSPLTMESGATLLTAACSCGVTQVRLSDGYDVVKTFRCPDLKR
ncbi:MAG: hypothetical protein HOP19_18040 [Acidobacteria bacterium]|nr:hypothetical protein [Acidobacteriota bacterium]